MKDGSLFEPCLRIRWVSPELSILPYPKVPERDVIVCGFVRCDML